MVALALTDLLLQLALPLSVNLDCCATKDVSHIKIPVSGIIECQ